jgi:hypothetical protein
MQEIVCSIICGCILLSISTQSLQIPHRLHLLTSSIWPSPKSCYNPLHMESGGLHVDSIRSGVEWSTLEKDWRWTEVGLMWSGRWTPQGSVGECKIQVIWYYERNSIGMTWDQTPKNHPIIKRAVQLHLFMFIEPYATHSQLNIYWCLVRICTLDSGGRNTYGLQLVDGGNLPHGYWELAPWPGTHVHRGGEWCYIPALL